MTERFVGRRRELAVLEELYDSGRPELFVLYGRRRVGKTELLQKLCQGRRAVYFLASQVREKDNLRAFRDALREGLGDPLLEGVEFPDWAAALGFAAERAGSERLILVLDEFPYLCEANKALPSILQQFWDRRGKRSSLFVILCGSLVSFMEKEVLAERSPLFGRRTGQRRLEPLLPSEALRFHEAWKLEDRLLAFAMLGGMPAYLQRFDDRLGLEENLRRDVLRPEGYLFDEVQFLLKTELSNPATYNSILGAVASGAERVGDIALAVGVDSTTANKYLHVLRDLRLVERSVPITDPDPLRSRRGTYRVADRFLGFHFRHIQPNLSLIEAGRGGRVLEEFIRPDFPRLLEEARTELMLEHLRMEAGGMLGDEVVETGPFRGRHVRAAGRLARGGGVACVAVEERALSPAKLEAELQELRAAFGAPIHELLYRVGTSEEEPVEVEIAMEGELR